MFKLSLALTAALIAGPPVVSAPSTADAQVLAGRNAARASAPRETRETRINNRIADAEERLFEIEERIAGIEALREDGAVLTPAQERQLAQLNARKEREQREIERLNNQLGD